MGQMKQTLVALVENKPGVLNRVASLFRRRNFNIDSLTVGRTENADVSRMTIVMDAEAADQVEKQLFKLVNVIEVQNVTGLSDVSRDLALIKVRANGQTRSEVIQLCDVYRAKIVDATTDNVIVEVTGNEEKISSLVELLRPFGILEMVRTGVVTMARGDHILTPDGYHPRPNANGNGKRATVV
ncbi:MAG: acetolactate synthase small subunit [Chloroflexi bacterium]|nr:acetolactate synthase small subunit [Chloroflexota bacterium]